MVRIEKYGYGMDLYIAEITRDQFVSLEKACAFFGNFYWRKSLQNTWYLNETKMQELFGVASFRQMKSKNHRYMGPVLSKRSDLDNFLADINIFENEVPVEIDPAKIKTSFKPMPQLPALTDQNVVVFHGEYFQGITAFDVHLSEAFSLRQLRLNLVDCGENGFVLQSISYKGKRYFGSEEAQSRGFLKPQFIVK